MNVRDERLLLHLKRDLRMKQSIRTWNNIWKGKDKVGFNGLE
jgi:hypothetical protein